MFLNILRISASNQGFKCSNKTFLIVELGVRYLPLAQANRKGTDMLYGIGCNPGR